MSERETIIVGTDLNKSFAAEGNRVHALRDVTFQVAEGEFYVLLGPSGSGKTTTLRVVAGLDQADEGSIIMDGRTVFSSAHGIQIPPEERPIAMVFQSYALWPHMNVYENIAFPLRRGIRRVARQEVARRVDRVVDLLRLEEHLQRPVSTLSGGQQQRVALARALALEPAVLLMDEPLSNLDARLRARLRLELKALTQSIGITTLYVTHDQTEAMVMGDRIAVMEQGRILQEGAPSTLYQHPTALFVAKFLGEMNLVPGKITGTQADALEVSTPLGPMRVAKDGSVAAQGAVTVAFRPEDVAPGGSTGLTSNILQVRVVRRHYLGDVYVYTLEKEGLELQMRRPKSEWLELDSEVAVQVPVNLCLALPAEAREHVP